MIAYEQLPDLCPECGVHGMQPCVDQDGRDVPDHSGRSVAFANGGGEL